MFCRSCYHLWEKEIKAKSEWTMFLQNNEAQRRHWDTYTVRGERKYVNIVWGLGTDIDIQNGKVIYLKERGEE